ncbi:MAG: transglycosylase SLT domain-containing protein [bacterium]|nr:transglycosylase SLT domain-containing protein [bacterium]
MGKVSDPDEIILIWGYPEGLLEEGFLDSTWIDHALELLGQDVTSESTAMTLKLLAAMNNLEEANSWVKWHRLRVENLKNWKTISDSQGKYLLAERLTMSFFKALKDKNKTQALEIAERLQSEGRLLGLPTRDRFIWDLRVRLLKKMVSHETTSPPLFFQSIHALGTYDTGNAWKIWTAHRKLNGYPAFPPSMKSKEHARDFAGLRRAWIKEEDISASSFSHDVKAGLGAKILKKEALNNHLASYPNPPADFTLQGWWVSGQRQAKRGQTEFYEQLGHRTDLSSGWRMDVLRRASEVHLLNGRWDPGLEDLGLALELASQKSGTQSLRRRLRQWVEQALVLALAQNKVEKAKQIHTLALNTFEGDELAVYEKETAHWRVEMGLEEVAFSFNGMKESSRAQVTAGQAPTLIPCSDSERRQFLTTAATPLWALWARWGEALISENSSRNIELIYREELKRCQNETDPNLQMLSVIQAVAPVLNQRLDKDILLRWILDKDVHHHSQGFSLTGISPFSDFAKKHLKDDLALHALLGLALLADDMRGIVGVATPMKKTGLTKEEKLCFLYPVPQKGAIHEALAGADNSPALLLAVARNESLFETSVRSHAGALGWMQIMPFHYPDKGSRSGQGNWSYAGTSIAKGDALLKENRQRYEGNPYKVLAGYNAGPGACNRWQKQLGESTRRDVFLAWIGYPETRHYVEKVLVDQMIYQWIINDSRKAH